MKTDLHTLYTVPDVRRLFFPSRSVRWVKNTFGPSVEHPAGEWGAVFYDASGLMVSAAAVKAWQDKHAVNAVIVPARELVNLRQVVAA